MKKLALILLSVIALGSAFAAEDAPKAKPEETPEAKVSATTHEIKIGGKTVKYTATAGTMLMKDEEGKPVALFGYTAYVADGVDQAKRPLMFAYNGGPGSASLWLHMGVLGPQRAVVTDAGFSPNGPFKRVSNEYSILDETDLVMIDPVGTGFSKPVGEAKGEDFWGVDQDIKSVSEFIVQYTTQNKRWASPKFVLGESYGGMRTGGVSYYLLSRHMFALNGVILVSPFMRFDGDDVFSVMLLPTFAATAWYHGALENKPEDLQSFLREVEKFALEDYSSVLLLGHRVDDTKYKQVLSRLAAYTGLTEDYWDRANLRISEGHFNKELMRQKGITVGRIDSRFVGNMINKLGETQVYDPMTTAIGPPYLAAFMDYYANDLKVEEAGNYKVFGDVFGQWDWGHQNPVQGFKFPVPDTLVDLGIAMTQNPGMKVLVQQGYYDLATPYLHTEYDLDHLDIAEELRANIVLKHYEAGHMMYVHEPSLVRFKSDLAEFIKSAY